MNYMIGIFVLLFIAVLVVIKYCKKKSKYILIISLIACYCVIVSIDMNRSNSLKKPIFAQEQNDNLTEANYNGLGYEIQIKKIDGKIESVTMYIFGKVIAASIT